MACSRWHFDWVILPVRCSAIFPLRSPTFWLRKKIPHRGGVCVCVWTIWIDVKLLFLLNCPFLNQGSISVFSSIHAGGGSRAQSLPPTKTLWRPWWYMAWSAMRTCFFVEWEEAQPKNLLVDSFRISEFHVLYGFRNLQFFLVIWHLFHFDRQFLNSVRTVNQTGSFR